MTRPDGFDVGTITTHLNHAYQALRIVEDHARRMLEDKSLLSRIAELRSALNGCMPEGSVEPLAGQGGEPREIGGEHCQAGEDEHRDPARTMLAAAARLTEAVAAIQEQTGTIEGVPNMETVEISRQAQELRERLGRTIVARERFGQVRLYVLLTESLCRGDWFATARAALEGGADCLQLREKELPDREVWDRAKRLAELCHEHGALFIVNDRPDLAVLSSADGVHVRQDDLSVAAVRGIVRAITLVDLSTHTP